MAINDADQIAAVAGLKRVHLHLFRPHIEAPPALEPARAELQTFPASPAL